MLLCERLVVYELQGICFVILFWVALLISFSWTILVFWSMDSLKFSQPILFMIIWCSNIIGFNFHIYSIERFLYH